MRAAVGIVLGLVSLLLALVFAVVVVTKIGSGSWIGYVAIAAYGLGAIGCALAARQQLRPHRCSRLRTRPVIGAALGLAALALAAFAVRAADFAASSRRSRVGEPRPTELVVVLVDGLGAAGCFAAARRSFARGDLDDSGIAATVVR